ncbi:MAG: transglutaminase domain-containing protein, partial [Bacteroidales bacterium]|nr:transglutaminase domain-containing protein [Bacteroidales bacterium]
MKEIVHKLWGCLLFLCCSCSSFFSSEQATQLELALQCSGRNRSELEKVLHHYAQDSLKLEAAKFLIRNMPYHGYHEGEELSKYYRYFELYSDGKHDPRQLADSLKEADGDFYMSCLSYRQDVETVDSALLVDNIDWAFKVWHEQPWGKHVCFEDFCEFVLPYRIGDELPVKWRERLYKEYNPLLDSIRTLPGAEDPLLAAQVLMDEWQKIPFHLTLLFPSGPQLGPNAAMWRTGSCREFADGVVYMLRSVGIPCGTDQVLLRGDNNESHFWPFVLDKDRHVYAAEPVPWTESEKMGIVMSKVHRNTFGVNREWQEQFKKVQTVYPSFRNACLRDVTLSYADSMVCRVTVSASELFGHVQRNEPVYLCLSSRLQWIPVDFSFMGNDEVSFDRVNSGNVCVLATWDGKSLHIQCDPFVVENQTGCLRFFHPEAKKEDVCIYAKFNVSEGFGDFSYRMAGGVVEGSNRSDFVDADTLHFIKEAPKRLFTRVRSASDRPYRYVRYRGADSCYCNISELVLYEAGNDSLPLRGRVIGTPGCWQNDGSHEYTNVFDGSPYTSFDYKEASGGWAGMDLGKPCPIGMIE